MARSSGCALLAFAFALLVAGCREPPLVPVCSVGSCEPTADAGVPEVVDGGPSCEVPCGSVCCGDGLTCRHGTCVPPCPSGVWCGRFSSDEVCCAVGEQCGVDGCFVPPTPSPSCDGGVWEPALQTCLDPVVTGRCEQPPPRADAFQPEVLWHFQPDDGYQNVITTPVVVDVNGDGAADVLATFYSNEEGFEGTAVIRAVSGVDGRELWKTPIDRVAGPLAPGGLVVAALDVSEELTVLALDQDFRLVAFNAHTGDELWRSRTKDGRPALCNVGWGAPAVANLNQGGLPEIVCGFSVFDHRGVLKWSVIPEASGPWGAVVALADLDGDGNVDITDGTRAYRHDGILLWDIAETVSGLPAVADFLSSPWDLQPDGIPEVLVVRGGRLELRDARFGSMLVAPVFLPAWDGFACYAQDRVAGQGGPPAIADVTFDGTPDVVLASGDCVGALTLQPNGPLLEWKLLWGHLAIDETSSTTAPALFDFDGDGQVDVVYADERNLHFLGGSHGEPRHPPLPHCSGTLYEGAVVADVDGDASANVIVGANVDRAALLGCSPDARPGLTAWRERLNRWANTRAVWNQHGHTPGGVCDGMDAVCAKWPDWNTPGRIPFELDGAHRGVADGVRFNSHGAWTPLGIANPAITHAFPDVSNCPRQVLVRVRVVNEGEAPLRVGTPVRLLSNGSTLASTETRTLVHPGGSEIVEIAWSPGAEAKFPLELEAWVGPLRDQLQCDPEDDGLLFEIASCG